MWAVLTTFNAEGVDFAGLFLSFIKSFIFLLQVLCFFLARWAFKTALSLAYIAFSAF